MTRIILKLILVSYLILSLHTFTYGESNRDREKFISMDFHYNHSNPNYYDYPFSMNYKHPIKNSRFWLTQNLLGVSFVNRKEYYNYSSKGLVSLSNCIIAGFVSNDRPLSKKSINSSLFTILSLPNSQIEYAITDLLYVGINNNTEYIFFRGKTGKRGIYYTPGLTFSLFSMAYNEGADTYELQILIGYTSFLNFEGNNESIGWTYGFKIGFGYVRQ